MKAGDVGSAWNFVKNDWMWRTGSNAGSLFPGMGMITSRVQKLLVFPWPRYKKIILLTLSTEILRRVRNLAASMEFCFGTEFDFRKRP